MSRLVSEEVLRFLLDVGNVISHREKLEFIGRDLFRNCPRLQFGEDPKFICVSPDFSNASICEPFGEFCQLKRWLADSISEEMRLLGAALKCEETHLDPLHRDFVSGLHFEDHNG